MARRPERFRPADGADRSPSTTRRRFAAVASGLAASSAGCIFGSDDGQDESGDDGDGEGPVPPEDDVDELLAAMSLEEKVGQMAQVNVSVLMEGGEWETGALDEGSMDAVLGERGVGSVLSGGGAAPVPNTPRRWAETTNAIQERTVETQGVPTVYGVDAVHGHSNLVDATMFPHNAGMGATWDPDLVRRVAETTAGAVRATGIHWNFSPVADLARDHRWGRYYECYGEDPLLVASMAAAETAGLQGGDGAPGAANVAATAKHFLGYSEPRAGQDRNPAHVPRRRLLTRHLAPFRAAVEAGAETVMLNSGSVNGVPVHASPDLVRGLLREELGFEGVVISDWADLHRLREIHEVGESMREAVRLGIEAGIDVYMVPIALDEFLPHLLDLVESGEISEERIDRSVRRVLRLKSRLGLFEEPTVDPGAAEDAVTAGRDLAYEAVAASLTLLENDGTLPLAGDEDLVVTGPAADSVRIQMGGWTVGWQGLPQGGDRPPAVTGLDGLRDAVGGDVTHVAWPLGSGGDESALADAAADADAAVVFLGEGPYAEGQGDDQRARLPAAQARAIRTAADQGTPVVAVSVMGRPLSVEAVADDLAAHLMAYLPGTAGGSAIADTLVGDVSPAGRLPFTWPRHVGQVPAYYDHYPGDGEFDPQYAFGTGGGYARVTYGRPSLDPGSVSTPALDATVDCSVTVENAGDRAADEVVLAVGQREFAPGPEQLPERTVVGFRRVSLDPGESREVTLSLSVGALATVGGDVFADGEHTVAPGEYTVRVGGGSTTLPVE